MKNKTTKRLENYDELFGLNDHDTVTGEASYTEIDLTKLVPFSSHPFRLYVGQQLNNMVESIKEFGVMIPIIVRSRKDDQYEILSGHNRVNASKLAGLNTIPAIIHENLSDDDAVLVVTETNFMQRSLEDMLPSEKAKAFEMEMGALKRQGKKTSWFFEENESSNPHNNYDEGTSTTMLSKWRSDESVAEKNNISREMVRRYRRLNYLISNLLSRVDNNEIALQAAVNVSYIKKEAQEVISQVMSKHDYKLDMKKAELLRSYSKSGILTEEKIISILSGELDKKKRTKKPAAFKLKTKIVSKYFKPEQDMAEIEEVIDRALTLYFKTSGHKKL